jgi:hypothetical protein
MDRECCLVDKWENENAEGSRLRCATARRVGAASSPTPGPGRDKAKASFFNERGANEGKKKDFLAILAVCGSLHPIAPLRFCLDACQQRPFAF